MKQWLPAGDGALAEAAREIQAGGTPVREHLRDSVQPAGGGSAAATADAAEPAALSADEELARQRMKQWMPAGGDALAAAAREIQAQGSAADQPAGQAQAAGEDAAEEQADDGHVRPLLCTSALRTANADVGHGCCSSSELKVKSKAGQCNQARHVHARRVLQKAFFGGAQPVTDARGVGPALSTARRH